MTPTAVSERSSLRELEREPRMTTAEHVRAGARHPLEPLTAEELETVSRILKRDRGLAASARFVYVTLREPAKDAVLRYQQGEAFEREAHVAATSRAQNPNPCRPKRVSIISICAS